MATCFDCLESSSGRPCNRSNYLSSWRTLGSQWIKFKIKQLGTLMKLRSNELLEGIVKCVCKI
jgi:maleate cis-trans isomerase